MLDLPFQSPSSQSASSPITISTLTTHITAIFEADPILRDVWVTGEVSTWKRAASGHIYFSLKDSGATITAVMWRNSATNHSWLPQAGDQILAHGYVGVYPARGAYQLYVNRIRPAGRGQLYAQFEEMKERLQAAGLFDAERKRPVTNNARRIGIVTSPNAAALRDILRVLTNRWPLADVIIFPTLVQGSDAPAQIAAAMQAANLYAEEIEPFDVILLSRGGGSIEDLWAFNDERVAHAIAESKLPVVVGVGHETDFTIADFIADLRMPTPSAAAAAVVPDRMEKLEHHLVVQERLDQMATQRLREEQAHAQRNAMRLMRLHPQRQLDHHRQLLDEADRRLHATVSRQLTQLHQAQKSASLRLKALNPLDVLRRGYSIVQQAEGQVVTAPEQAMTGDQLTIRSAGGEYRVIKS